jgi:DNA-directed RNA polymerase alpha subunit
MTNSKDITKFLQDVSVIREFHLKNLSTTFTPDAKKKLDVFVKGEITELSDKYPNLESPEKEYLESIKNFYGLGDNKNKYDYSEIEKGKTPLDTPITEFDFTVRALNSLKRTDIGYLGEVVQIKKSQFLKFRYCGAKTLKDIEKVVSKEGYKLGMDIDYVKPEDRK